MNILSKDVLLIIFRYITRYYNNIVLESLLNRTKIINDQLKFIKGIELMCEECTYMFVNNEYQQYWCICWKPDYNVLKYFNN